MTLQGSWCAFTCTADLSPLPWAVPAGKPKQQLPHSPGSSSPRGSPLAPWKPWSSSIGHCSHSCTQPTCTRGFCHSRPSPPWSHWTIWLKLLQIKVSPMEVFPFTHCSALPGTQLHLWQLLQGSIAEGQHPSCLVPAQVQQNPQCTCLQDTSLRPIRSSNLNNITNLRDEQPSIGNP